MPKRAHSIALEWAYSEGWTEIQNPKSPYTSQISHHRERYEIILMFRKIICIFAKQISVMPKQLTQDAHHITSATASR